MQALALGQPANKINDYHLPKNASLMSINARALDRFRN